MIVLVERIKDACSKPASALVARQDIPSLNGFVPKPNTPFQWEPICEEKELSASEVCQQETRRIPNVEVRAMSARIAHEQALFSSGDRRLLA